MTTTNTIESPTAMTHIEAFFSTHDTSHIAENAVFKNLNTGQDTIGREAIGQMLNYLYHIAFDANAIVSNTIVTDKKAVLEATFAGRHIGEFANIPPTHKEVNVPLCVVYDLNKDGLIQEARIYMLMDIMIQQLHS